jgi:protein O-GlcNAc transferase
MGTEAWPELSFPLEEMHLLRRVYDSAHIILEYGSGGSTVLGSEQPGNLVFSVESDHAWAIRLQHEIDLRNLPSPALVYHVDIGPTGNWGRPLGPEAWTRFHRYPLAIWDEPFFRQPDVVLIDGRFRPACLMAVLLRTQKPVTVLFDDYTERPAYHSVEAFLKPTEMVGRMAVFDVQPRPFDPSETGAIMDHFFRATYHGKGDYGVPPSEHGSIGVDAQIKDRGHD